MGVELDSAAWWGMWSTQLSRMGLCHAQSLCVPWFHPCSPAWAEPCQPKPPFPVHTHLLFIPEVFSQKITPNLSVPGTGTPSVLVPTVGFASALSKWCFDDLIQPEMRNPMSSAWPVPITARGAQGNRKDFVFPFVSSFLQFVSAKIFHFFFFFL